MIKFRYVIAFSQYHLPMFHVDDGKSGFVIRVAYWDNGKNIFLTAGETYTLQHAEPFGSIEFSPPNHIVEAGDITYMLSSTPPPGAFYTKAGGMSSYVQFSTEAGDEISFEGMINLGLPATNIIVNAGATSEVLNPPHMLNEAYAGLSPEVIKSIGSLNVFNEALFKKLLEEKEKAALLGPPLPLGKGYSPDEIVTMVGGGGAGGSNHLTKPATEKVKLKPHGGPATMPYSMIEEQIEEVGVKAATNSIYSMLKKKLKEAVAKGEIHPSMLGNLEKLKHGNKVDKKGLSIGAEHIAEGSIAANKLDADAVTWDASGGGFKTAIHSDAPGVTIPFGPGITIKNGDEFTIDFDGTKKLPTPGVDCDCPICAKFGPPKSKS